MAGEQRNVASERFTKFRSGRESLCFRGGRKIEGAVTKLSQTVVAQTERVVKKS